MAWAESEKVISKHIDVCRTHPLRAVSFDSIQGEEQPWIILDLVTVGSLGFLQTAHMVLGISRADAAVLIISNHDGIEGYHQSIKREMSIASPLLARSLRSAPLTAWLRTLMINGSCQKSRPI
jgi:hypothetical protein